MDISIRSTEMELMDTPNVDGESLKMALSDINRCNIWLGGAAITRRAVRNLIKNHPKKSYTILDVGCGDGFMLRYLANSLKNSGVTFNFVGVDVNDAILRIANEEAQGMDNIHFKNVNIMSDHGMECDIVTCTLMLHHLEEEEIPLYLEKFAEMAKLGVVINDLQRSPFAHSLFKVFSSVFLRSSIARNDGLVSIRRGFQKDELYRWTAALDYCKHSIQWKWAFRYLWVMCPNSKYKK